MSDILGIADADLRNNNSVVYQYLDHLTSNSIYTDLLIANSAFIQELTSEIITVGSVLTVGNASPVAVSGDYSDLENRPSLKPVATSGDYSDLSNKPALKTVATSGSYTDLTDKPTIPDVSNLADKDVFAQKLGYSNYADLVEKAASSEYGTITQNGYIRTSLIDAEAIWADIISATSATFENITISSGKVDGELSATKGCFYLSRRYIYDLLLSEGMSEFFTFLHNKILFFSNTRYYNCMGFMTIEHKTLGIMWGLITGLQLYWLDSSNIEVRVYTQLGVKNGNFRGEQVFIFNEKTSGFNTSGVFTWDAFNFLGITIEM